MPEEYVTVVFNELHESSVTSAMYASNEFNVEPYELPDWVGRKAAIVQCPEGRGQYQADRYTSFMFGSRVFPTKAEAEAHLASY